MIHYQLRCDQTHGFDGWFRDSAGFETQVRAGLVTCPVCGSAAVERALMAPSIPRKGAKATKVVDQEGRAEPTMPGPAAAPPVPAPVAGAAMPDQVLAVLQKLRAVVESNCEHVGDRFAEEARAIHNGEAEQRGIFGQSTPEQIEALAEDGIEVARIPWVKRADG